TLKTTTAVAYKNAVKYLFNKVAYDFAVKLSTGNKGQQPLFIDQPLDKYLATVGDEALGMFFNDIGRMWGAELCSPIDRPWVKAVIHIQAKASFEPSKPTCTWTQIKKNIGDVRKMNFADVFQIKTQFEPGQNDFGAYLEVVDQARSMRIAEEEAAKINTVAKQGFQDLQSTISGKVKTPASFYGGFAAGLISDSLIPYGMYTGEAAADAIGLFTNTLVSRLLEKAFKQGFNSAANTGPFDLFGTLGFLQAAKDQFADLANPDYNLGGSVDVINKLAACGASSAEYGDEQFACTIDTGFARAVEQKLTLQEALSQRLIKGDQPFGYNGSGTEPNFREGLPYRSILILRKYRIVPVGWELAAEYYKNFDLVKGTTGNLTLNKLVAAYNEPTSPYFKLVDPNWQLKAPETICYKEGPGPDIIDVQDISLGNNQTMTMVTRRTYCADERSCIMEGPNGSCQFFGYCVAEKPIWKIKGSECPAYYNSCQSLTESVENKNYNYLKNTLASCTEANCSAFCENYNPVSGKWECGVGELSYYLAEKTCDSRDDGCTALTRVTNAAGTPLSPASVAGITDLNNTDYLETPTNLRLGPSFCDGYLKRVPGKNDRAACEAGNNFWRSDINACVESGNNLCANFTNVCQAEDISCKLYQPVSVSAPAVPAVITPKVCSDATCSDENVSAWNDECPAVCAGFRTFTQMKTDFENGSAASFLSDTAKTCSLSGCDEFTNLDKLAAGGENKEYYSYLRTCVKPDDSSVKIFYTWEGSETTGYQLRKWQLSSDFGDRPQGNTCVIGTAGVDCREFYNPDTNKYYQADFATVVFADADCHPFRRSLINSQAECENSSNLLGTTGTWTNGACIYMALPSRSTSCSADNAGCRTYRDNSSYNFQILLTENFENGAGKFSGGTVAGTSVYRGEHSLNIATAATAVLSAGDLNGGDFYSLSFIAMGSGNVIFSLKDSGTNLVSKTQKIGADWQLYKIDLGELGAGTYQNPQLTISGTLYLDDITLKKINNILVIKNSWEKNVLCENLSVKGMSSCEAYSDNTNRTLTLQKFSNLCLEDAVGCEAFLTSDRSNWLYLVYDKNKECQTTGCRQLGALVRDRFDPEAASKFSFTTKYVVVNESDTCSDTEEGCRQYNFSSGNAFALYKNPGNRVCEYREQNGVYGWYVSGEDRSCPSVDGLGLDEDKSSATKYCLGGRSLNKDNSCESNDDCVDYKTFSLGGICTSWSGLCSSTASGCEEYQDPYEPEFCDASLLPKQKIANQAPCDYYYYSSVEIVGIACSEADLKDLSKHCFLKTNE
ncbi:MAG: hypothetical protein PHT40_01995, partial [Patescibacteria group bacterium]|nr:hypothetical protein [Patescibacteria group bacterium]